MVCPEYRDLCLFNDTEKVRRFVLHERSQLEGMQFPSILCFLTNEF